MIAELYTLIPRHGASVLFLAALLSCAGVPIPTSALMLAAGAFVASGDMQFLPVALTTLAGAILGDQIGYGAGRAGGGERRKEAYLPPLKPPELPPEDEGRGE